MQTRGFLDTLLLSIIVPYSIMVIQSPSNCRKQKLLYVATHTQVPSQLSRRPKLRIYRTVVGLVTCIETLSDEERMRSAWELASKNTKRDIWTSKPRR